MIDARGLDKPVDHASWGPLRALYEWLKPATMCVGKPQCSSGFGTTGFAERVDLSEPPCQLGRPWQRKVKRGLRCA